ncbi:MAG: hypothetical protein K0R51_2150 [Cytophagaceae bacterium]|jgi:hypothetical protein|nr:hypothetical protein [Cytophagaceae bacterium]
MKNNTFFIVAVSLLIFSCSSEEVITEIVSVPAIRASYIYHADSVLLYLEQNKDNYNDLSNAYLLKAAEIENQDLDKAIYYCKRAITIHPTLELYTALGDLLIKAKHYEDAYELYSFITQKRYRPSIGSSNYIFSAPSENLLYQSIVIHHLKYGYFDSYDIHHYKELGFDIKQLEDRLLHDQRLTIDTTPSSLNVFKLLFMTDEEIEEYKNSEEVYKDFLASIPDTSSVFEINSKQVSQFKYGREYEEMDAPPAQNSFYANFLQEIKDTNSVWYEYNYNHIYPLYNNITVIVYAIDTSEAGCPKDMRHIYHRLVLYNNKGEIINHKVIAFQSGDDLATATVNQEDISVKFFKRKWRNPYNKKDFDNDLIKIEEIGSVSYKMNVQGQIVQRGSQPDTTSAPL